MRVLIFGSRGYLGKRFKELYPAAVTPDIDIADGVSVKHLLDQEKPDVVINAAGKTGRPNVDWCEDHKEETIRSNVGGPLILLEECGKRGIYWVQLSTGCIYEGTKGTEGFAEEDPPNFFGSFYSRTKGWIDQMLKEFPVLQLRLRMPFDGSRNDRNLIVKLTKYDRVLDAPNSITYVPDFMKAAEILIGKRAIGIWNVVNPGGISGYEIMQMYREIVDPSHAFERLTLEKLPTATKAGRSNCILSTQKAQREGIVLRPVAEAVREALQSLRNG